MWARNTADGADVAIISDSRSAVMTLSRIVRAAGSLRDTICVPSVEALNAEAGPRMRLIACGAHDAAEIFGSPHDRYRASWLLVWTPTPDRNVFELAAGSPQVACVLGWPNTGVIPRPWEISLCVRRLVLGDSYPIGAHSFIQGNGAHTEWLPNTTAELQATIEAIGDQVGQLGVSARFTRRIVGVAHEMLMNAMYDAPVDDSGCPKYAHNRTSAISLTPRETPCLSLASDGLTLVLQVADPFGGLRREHVYRSIQRGFRSQDPDAKREEIIDTSHGGAGLGIHRIVFGADATVFDVVDGTSTVVTTSFELGRSNREMRTSPKSLLFFRRGVNGLAVEHPDAG